MLYNSKIVQLFYHSPTVEKLDDVAREVHYAYFNPTKKKKNVKEKKYENLNFTPSNFATFRLQ